MNETEQANDQARPRRLAYPMRVMAPIAHFSRRSIVTIRRQMAPVRAACDLVTMVALGALIATIVLELTLVMAPWLAMMSVALGLFVIARLVASSRRSRCGPADGTVTRSITSSRTFWG